MWTCPKCSWSNTDDLAACSCGYQFNVPSPQPAPPSPPRWWDKLSESTELSLGCAGSLFLMVLFLVLGGFLASYYRPLSFLCLGLMFTSLVCAIKFFWEMDAATKLKALGGVFVSGALLWLLVPIVLLAKDSFSGENLASLAPSVVFALIGVAFWWGGRSISRIKPRE